jgi:RimJ/RimL family protein N-acetyltransferase
MNTITNLFESEHLCLTPIDIDKDAVVEAAWTESLEYAQWLTHEPAHPLSAFELKKMYEEKEKAESHGHVNFFFAVHQKLDDKLAGFVRIPHVLWSNNISRVRFDIPDTEWMHTYGLELVQLVLNYAFNELNLFVITVDVSETDETTRAVLEQAGFVLEVRQRQALYRHNRYLDLLIYAIQRPAWDLKNGRPA